MPVQSETGMTSPASPEKPSSARATLRRITVFGVIAVLLFAVLWYTVFSAVTAAIIAAGGTGVLIAGSTVSDTFDWVIELLSSILLAILAGIAAVVAAITSLFDW
jgi:hypothetical protein